MLGLDAVAFSCRWERTPDRFLRTTRVLVERRLGASIGTEFRVDVLLCRCAVFDLHADHVAEVFPLAMLTGDVESAIALPKTLAWLLLGPRRNLVEEVVEVAGVADIHLPMPEEVVLGVLVREVLYGHVSASVGTVDGQVAVHALLDAAIDKAHLPL